MFFIYYSSLNFIYFSFFFTVSVIITISDLAVICLLEKKRATSR